MLDLLIIFIPNLAMAQSTALFNATATPLMLEHADATVQKKSYRVLKRLLEAGRLSLAGQALEEFVEKLNAVGGGVGPGAQRVGFPFSLCFSQACLADMCRIDFSYSPHSLRCSRWICCTSFLSYCQRRFWEQKR